MSVIDDVKDAYARTVKANIVRWAFAFAVAWATIGKGSK